MVGDIPVTLTHNIACISVDTSNTVYIVHPIQYSMHECTNLKQFNSTHT